MPSEKNYFGHPRPFNRDMVAKIWEFGGEYNILTHHTRFNYLEIKSIMPSDTIYVTILRDPVQRFESMFAVCFLDRFWNFTLDQLNEDNFTIPSAVYTDRFGWDRFNKRFGWNQMMFDLGMNVSNFLNVRAVDNYINYIDKIFDLVMINEQMTESLVLLREKMCWTNEDVITLKV
jgi:hypothetical protein